MDHSEDQTSREYADKVQSDCDFEIYKIILDSWSKENPIKTNKFQVLLAVNGLLVTAVSISGGFSTDKWYLYLAGFLFSLVWTFSIGRTSLYQAIWKSKLQKIQNRYPHDPRFAILDTAREKKEARFILRLFGGISSKWYLLFAPFGFAAAWLIVLLYAIFR